MGHELDQVLSLMRQAVMNGTYVLTPHALMELVADNLDVIDMESAILTGKITGVFDDDARSPVRGCRQGLRFEL